MMRDAIAIVGMGCRFPGASSPQAFWQLLTTGKSSIQEVFEQRWKKESFYDPDPTRPGKTMSCWGGFLDQVDQFDWRAFRLLPHEAESMDPQHRLLLEVAWEALEDAGLPFSEVAGSCTSVFIGIGWNDYLRLQTRNWAEIDGYTGTGNENSLAAHRLSYFFDLKGPSVALSTGCTSSLTSLYLACQSLWAHEADLALAGGVSLLLSPDTHIMASKAGLLAPDGRCKTFDAHANGFVLGEGAGILVLKPLSQVKPSDRVYALIQGISSNHNGHNEWIIATSQAAQEQLLRTAYQRAAIDPAEVDYVELHGTGFMRGDSVEANALGAVLGAADQRTHPCLVGSVKTNIGHLGAAAGVASVIKVALALFHREIPPTLNFTQVNPLIDLQRLHLDLPMVSLPWPEKGGPPFAGVSTFSLAGANAHAVLTASPDRTETVERRRVLLEMLPLSAHTQEALYEYAASFRDFLREDTTAHMAWQDICYTASVRRTHRPYRLAITGRNAQEAAQALDAFLREERKRQDATETKREVRKLAFLFTSILPRVMWEDREFLYTEAAFQTTLRESEYFAQKYAGLSIIEEMLHTRPSSSPEEMFSPLASFVLQVALAEHWRSWGVTPEIVAGDEWGALAAAYIADAITLEEAIRILLSATANGKTALPAAETPVSSQEAIRYDLYMGGSGLIPKGTPSRTLSRKLRANGLNFSDELQQFGQAVRGDILLLEFGPPRVSAAQLQDHNSLLRRISLLYQEPLNKEVLLKVLGFLYMQGISINWAALYDETQHCVTLPSFPWQRETAWPEWLSTEIISTPPEYQSALISAKPQVQPASERDLSSLPLEEALAILWAEILKLKSVNIHESFFELGGHSLLAAQLLARIQTVFHIDLSLSVLLSAPTPATCAQVIRQQDSTQRAPVVALPVIKDDPDRRYEPFALTDVQLAYWVGRTIPLGSTQVGNHGYIEVKAHGLDIARFNRAMQSLIQRHEMLRAVLLPGNQQHILETVPPFEATIVNLQGKDIQEVAASLRQIRQEMDHQLLSVEQWPAFDIRIILLDEGQCQIHLSVESLFVDAWSMHLLIREFVHFYFHPAISLPELELSFRDYIQAERALRGTDLYRQSERYWKQRVGSLPPAPDLPLVHNTISEVPLRFVHYQARLNASDWNHLKARAARARLTPSGVLLAAFAEILGTWSKSSRFSINISLFNRLPLHPQVHDIVGDFTSLTVFAVDNTTRDTFEERAHRVQEQLWKDLDHNYYNGIHVLRELATIQGNMAEAVMPIVFTSLLIQDVGYHSPVPWQEIIYSLSQTPQVWLDHQVLESQGDLVFHWQVIEDLFPEGYIKAIFSAYTQLLQRLATEEDLWQASSLELLPREQLEQRVQDHEPFALQEDCLLQDLFTRQVYKQPESIAVITPQQKLSYGEVYSTALLLAGRLKQAGAKSGHCVGIVIEKGWQQVVAVLGILYAGAVYVPIDPELPAERLHYLLTHAEIEFVVTQSHLDSKITWPATVQRLCLDMVESAPSPLPEYQASIQKPEDLAYLIYTSGSTGTPKGVMINHRGAVNTILDINTRFSIGNTDRVLAVSELSFDLSVYDIFGLLAAGGTIVFPAPEASQDPFAWLELLIQEQVTIWNTVPALLQLLLEFAEAQALSLQGSRLRLALLSGDWIPLTLPGHLKEHLPEVEVIGLGGATEASIWSILYPIEQVRPEWKSIPYGRPMRNQRWYVLNERLDPCPTWVPGQLYIGGVGLAQGYWHDEQKTRASFIIHPDTGERLYKTGDLGRYLPDGLIEFIGREDFQVKVQGHRIELGEIEVALARHPQVQKSVVIALGEQKGAKRLVAYFVAPNGAVNHSELRQFLAGQLPAYMLPSSFVQLEQLPLTANGKVDRKALPIPAQYSETGEYQFSLVETDLAARVTHILKQALNVEQIDPFTNLLEYGATSLDILHIVNQLQSQLAVRLSPRLFYQHSTLATLVQYCEQYLQADGADEMRTMPEAMDVASTSDSSQDWEEGSL